jgi:hypothetical protein
MSTLVISFEDLPTLRLELTPGLEAALEQSDKEMDWQPIYDYLSTELEEWVMANFCIDDTRIYGE